MINNWDELYEAASNYNPDSNAPARATYRAAKVLEFYHDGVGTDTVATSLADLVTDLMHLSDVIGSRPIREDFDFGNFDDVLATSRMHYRDECLEHLSQ